MRRVIGFGQVLKVQSRIKLRGGYIGMTEHFLHSPQVLCGLQDVAGKAVSQYVGVNMRGQPGVLREFGELELNHTRTDSAPA